MQPAIRSLKAGEKPSQPGWYVVHVPQKGQIEIVRVHVKFTKTSEKILSVTFSGSGDHHPLATIAVTFIAKIDPEQIEQA